MELYGVFICNILLAFYVMHRYDTLLTLIYTMFELIIVMLCSKYLINNIK